MTVLELGDVAPSFVLPDQSGRMVKLTDYRTERLLVYFYPKADTSGCTAQSCAVRDAHEDFGSLGVGVLGISPDLRDRQQRFDAKYGLGFPLLSDPDHAVADAYGVWGEKSLYGNRYFGIVRSSFLIDPDGRIEQAWYKISPAQTVPKAMKALTASAER